MDHPSAFFLVDTTPITTGMLWSIHYFILHLKSLVMVGWGNCSNLLIRSHLYILLFQALGKLVPCQRNTRFLPPKILVHQMHLQVALTGQSVPYVKLPPTKLFSVQQSRCDKMWGTATPHWLRILFGSMNCMKCSCR